MKIKVTRLSCAINREVLSPLRIIWGMVPKLEDLRAPAREFRRLRPSAKFVGWLGIRGYLLALRSLYLDQRVTSAADSLTDSRIHDWIDIGLSQIACEQALSDWHKQIRNARVLIRTDLDGAVHSKSEED